MGMFFVLQEWLSYCANRVGGAGAQSQQWGWSVWGSCKRPTSWAEEGLVKGCPPVLCLVRRAPSNFRTSSTLPTAGKYFKLLPLFRVSLRSLENACPLQVTGISAYQSAPTLSGVQPHSPPKPSASVDSCSQSSTALKDAVCRVPEHLPLPALSSSSCLWAEVGEGLGSTLSRLCNLTLLCLVFSSSPGGGSLFWSLQVIFRVSCFCCPFLYFTILASM